MEWNKLQRMQSQCHTYNVADGRVQETKTNEEEDEKFVSVSERLTVLREELAQYS